MGNNSEATATDVITYVGIPLAVLGVLPTLSTTIRSIFTQRAVKRTLAQNGITDAVARGSLLSGIVEIEIPRKSIIPLDRTDPRYRKLNPSPSALRGGSWTTFQWKEMNIGMRSYRIQYHDELAQPQAEIDLEPLIAFLLDRGAVPCVAGFADLKSSGLWTPAGTRLLLSPDTTDAVLMIAKSDDSDGILSLSLNWKAAWDRRWSGDSLPPYWVRIRPGYPMVRHKNRPKDSAIDEKKALEKGFEGNEGSLSVRTSESESTAELQPIRLRVSASGVDYAHYEDSPKLDLRLPYHHRPSTEMSSSCLWVNTALTALAAPSSGLWSFVVPTPALSFASRESVPVGVLVVLGIIPDNDPPNRNDGNSSSSNNNSNTNNSLPAWRSHAPDEGISEEEERFERMQRLIRQSDQMAQERSMTPEQAMKSRMQRQRDDLTQVQRDQMQRRLREERRAEREITDALASTRLSSAAVGGMAMQWLVENEHVDREVGMTLAGVVESVVYDVLLDPTKAGRLSDLLEMWRSWSESGGMARLHLDELHKNKRLFCEAACVVALVRENCANPAGSVASDLQECLRIWRKVRLG